VNQCQPQRGSIVGMGAAARRLQLLRKPTTGLNQLKEGIHQYRDRTSSRPPTISSLLQAQLRIGGVLPMSKDVAPRLILAMAEQHLNMVRHGTKRRDLLQTYQVDEYKHFTRRVMTEQRFYLTRDGRTPNQGNRQISWVLNETDDPSTIYHTQHKTDQRILVHLSGK
jgi:hypothetical protein